MSLDSLSFLDIDVNLCWEYDEMFSNTEISYFNVLPTCDNIPTVLIENPDGKFKLQFKKEKSAIKIRDNKLWYNKANLTSITKIC
jgi:adenine specific DNA methylase Mod